jgi:hypothetical protein
MSLSENWVTKITSRFDGRFTYFYCRNFLSESDARRLFEAFPLSQLEALREPDVAHSTISTYRNPELFHEIIVDKECWQSIYTEITSPEFVRNTLLEFRDVILRRYPPLFRTIAKRWILNAKRYSSELQFSVRWTGSVLSPHTDNADKVLALVIYLPEAGQELESGGTAFYLPRSRRGEMRVFQRYLRFGWLVPLGMRRLRSTKLPTSDSFSAEDLVREHLKFFDDNYRIAFDAPFHLGSAGGFIKNQYSWHDVRLNNFAERAPRRTLLVNVMMRPSRARTIMNRLLNRKQS